MDMQLLERPSQKTDRFRRIGFLVFPDCEILDVCGPFEAFFFADHWLGRLGRTAEPGYQPIIIAATPGPDPNHVRNRDRRHSQLQRNKRWSGHSNCRGGLGCRTGK